MRSPDPRHSLALLLGVLLVAAACSGAEESDASPQPPITALAGVDGDTVTSSPRPATGSTDDTMDTATTEPATTTASTTTALSSTTTSTTSSTTSTTTTPPASTTTVAAGFTTGSIGVVGCSNTGQAVDGYLTVSAEDLLAEGELGGGSAPLWGNPASGDYGLYWGLYDQRRPAGGYAAAWVQICLRSSEHGGAFDAAEQGWAAHIVEQIHARDPGIQIWISPINFYADGHLCPSTGWDGPAIAAETADWAATSFANVARGPDLGPLTPSHIGVRDDCHPNGAGELLMGEQLSAFFD